jgi:glucose-6-phosphate isomerase
MIFCNILCRYSRSAGELMLDFSKNTIDDAALDNLLGLLEEANVEA